MGLWVMRFAFPCIWTSSLGPTARNEGLQVFTDDAMQTNPLLVALWPYIFYLLLCRQCLTYLIVTEGQYVLAYAQTHVSNMHMCIQ